MLPNEFIAVTGTNGKTTTVELIGHIHREAGLAVAVAGNVGTARQLAGRLGEPGRATIACEASSFQLQDTLAFAPEAAVLLNIAPDHLDRHGTLRGLYARQARGVRAPGQRRRRRRAAGTGRRGSRGLRAARVLWNGAGSGAVASAPGSCGGRSAPLLGVGEIRLRGAHNVENAMAAAAVCLARGVDPDAVRAGLRSFRGVAHRLEEVASRSGVLYVNDSKATNVASTLVALEAFADAPGIHLILGGQAKGQDFAALREPVAAQLPGGLSDRRGRAADRARLAAPGVALRDSGELERGRARGRRERPLRGRSCCCRPPVRASTSSVDYEDRGERFRELAWQHVA